MSKIGKKLIAAVREAANGNPEYVYKQVPVKLGSDYISECVYAYDGKPSCIVGHGLIDTGIIAADELEKSSLNESGINKVLSSDCSKDRIAFPKLEKLAAKITPLELAWLDHVQMAQDREVQWGKAVRDADNWLKAEKKKQENN